MTTEQLDAIPFGDGSVRPVILGGKYVGYTKVDPDFGRFVGMLNAEPSVWHCGEYETRDEAANAVRERHIIRVFRANPNAEVWLHAVERED